MDWRVQQGSGAKREGYKKKRAGDINKNKGMKKAAVLYETKKGGSMTKYRCIVCGYIYDPAVGDSSAGIVPGTSFEDLPADWICPECGVDKSQFEVVAE